MPPAANQGITLQAQNITTFLLNIATPGRIIVQDRRAVGIVSDGLSNLLATYYEAGVRHVEVIVDVSGQRLTIDASIYRKVDKRTGRVRYWLYPLGAAQSLLRDLLLRHRVDAPRHAKRPLPVVILATLPKPKK